MTKILVADDDLLERKILSAVLEKNGHETILAENGGQAWDLLQREKPRLLITDWSMPSMDGMELIQTVRSADLPGYVYIILLTAKGDSGDVVAGLKAGADDYLTKPFNVHELEARIAVGERILRLEDKLTATLSQLEQQAMYDGLTNVMNRRAVYLFAQGELERARRADDPFSLIFLDIDNLKTINDQYGHLYGDVAIKAVARTLQTGSRPYDGVGRWAGDEFVIVLPGVDAANARKVANRILQNMNDQNLPIADKIETNISLSAGIVTINKVVNSDHILDALVDSADEALYRAKRNGRNQVQFNIITTDEA
jgi:two-component system chemotaxis response regulator CheY